MNIADSFCVANPSNLSSTTTTKSSVSCAGCGITAAPTILTYTNSVVQVTANSSVTVIPYVTVYDSGENVTHFSTYTQYSSGASGAGLHTSGAPIVWTTLGTTLTFPTTYIAYPSVKAGAYSLSGDVCISSATSVKLQPSDVTHLIFPLPSGEGEAQAASSAAEYIESLPSITALVAPNDPSQCSFLTPNNIVEATATQAPAKSSIEAVTHTSVRLLTSLGQSVIVRSSGTALPDNQGSTSAVSPPPTSTAGNGGTGSHSGGGGGGTGGGSSGGGSSIHSTPTSTPVLVIEGSTITAGPSGVFIVPGPSGSITITPGGSAQVVGTETISVASGASVAVINGQTSSIVYATGGAYAGPAPVFAMRLWVSCFALGFLSMVFGLCL